VLESVRIGQQPEFAVLAVRDGNRAGLQSFFTIALDSPQYPETLNIAMSKTLNIV
jgi:hypothetical protein